MSVQQRNNVHVSGSGPVTLVFGHGFGGSQAMWRYLRSAFEGRYRIVVFDLVGSGRSDLGAYDRTKYASLSGYAADLLDILTEFTDAPVVFIGHSVSATIGMLTAIQAPERFAALVMVAPSPSFIDSGDYIGGFGRADIDELLETLESNYFGWSNGIAPTIMGAPERPELGDEMAASLCRADPDIAKHFARVVFLTDSRDKLDKLRVPTLILQSSEDFLAPLAVGEYMQRNIPDCTLSVIENTGHCPHLSAPAACTDAIASYLHGRGL
ncbi:alpha/beta hydrolase [Robbsia sp. Bb-Pol-6]|uniref:Alpha/beta hydrolase n=1 Tax=Robbsia betulipollinis TaxID=2981849 RepID=A0ABT3ZRQ5_9BURK|nr:alpha/beta hydrolase [Robbsia betulipollinis]MCY0389248.1 alpha/beta hydrolase [Robbsia betulipollinis]